MENITTCAVSKCTWSIQGRRKTDGGSSEKVEKEGVAGDAYYTFADEGENDSAEWLYLNITCSA
jgi:hypothetical protein